MAKRENYDDLDELLGNGAELSKIHAGSIKRFEDALRCCWFRISTEYKTEHSANASASIFRRKLGRDRVRVAARGRFVYVYFKPVEVAEAA